MALCPDATGKTATIHSEALGKYVWSGTTDKKITIHVWNAEVWMTFALVDWQTGALEKEITEGHTKKVNAFSVVGDRIWSAGDDNIVCVWNSQVCWKLV